MLILGLTGSLVDSTFDRPLLEFTLSIFDQTNTEVLNVRLNESVNNYSDSSKYSTCALSNANHLRSSNLIILSLVDFEGSFESSFNYYYDLLERDIESNCKPVVLLFSSIDSIKLFPTIDSIETRLKDIGFELWGVFLFPDSNENFEEDFGISNIPKRIEICRLINGIQYSRLKIKDSSVGNCGIVRLNNECGDENDY